MGNAVLAGVNPLFGLYTLIIATPLGALFTSSVFMNVSTTGALSVAAGDALYHVADDQKINALATLIIAFITLGVMIAWLVTRRAARS